VGFLLGFQPGRKPPLALEPRPVCFTDGMRSVKEYFSPDTQQRSLFEMIKSFLPSANSRTRLVRLVRPLVFAPLLAALVSALGCSGGKPSLVKGKVTLDGKPVKGDVVFVGEKEHAMPINADGTYSIPNLKKGTYKVAVRPRKAPPGVSEEVAAIPTGGTGKDAAPTAGGAATVAVDAVPPPAKYAAPNSSGLSFEVKGGEETYDIPLTK
jgi:hypothetical protein